MSIVNVESSILSSRVDSFSDTIKSEVVFTIIEFGNVASTVLK